MTSVPHHSESVPGRDRFLAACASTNDGAVPLWLMRQAGRALPEYRDLRRQHSFVEMVQNPQLAAEITLQPIRRFGFDAAILFSDILVIPEALGQPYHFQDGRGVQMDFLVRTQRDVDQLDPGCIHERLGYVAAALRILRAELSDRTALIGFTGSPWTLATFMVGDSAARDASTLKSMFHTEPALFAALFEKITAAVLDYVTMQIQAGVDAIQIFESVGGALPAHRFWPGALSWVERIVAHIDGRVPVVLFAKGAHAQVQELLKTGARVLSLDWTASLGALRRALGPQVPLQGNLDPWVLTSTPAVVRAETLGLLESMRGDRGYVFNLGHGVPPSTTLENLEALVDTVRTFR